MHKPVKRHRKLWGKASVCSDVHCLILIIYLKQCPRASFWPTLMHMNMAPECIAQTHTYALKMFCIHSLMLISLEDYTFWEQWFPVVKVSAYFHVSVQNPAVSGTHSHLHAAPLQCSVSTLSPHFRNSFLPSHFSHPVLYIVSLCPVVRTQ